MKAFICFLALVTSLFVLQERQEDRPQQIPDEFQGVWTVNSVLRSNGEKLNSSDNGFHDSNPSEIVIVGNRIFTVDGMGGSVATHCKVVLSKPGSCVVTAWTSLLHDKEQEPTHWKLTKTDDDHLAISLAVSEYEKDPRREKTTVPTFDCTRDTGSVPTWGYRQVDNR